MFDDSLSKLNRCRDTFQNTVTDSFGNSIIEKCFDPMLDKFHLIKNINEESIHDENGIRMLLNTLRLIV